MLQPRLGIATVLDSVTCIQLYYSLLLTHLFQPCSGSPFLPPGPNSYISPIMYPFTPLRSLLSSASPPNLPGCGATIHMDGAPTRRPPPLVCASLPYWSYTRISLRKPVTIFPLSPPPYMSSICTQVPFSPMVSPFRGSLPPSACLYRPHVCSPFSEFSGFSSFTVFTSFGVFLWYCSCCFC